MNYCSPSIDDATARIATLEAEIRATRDRLRNQLARVRAMRDEGVNIDLACQLLRLLLQSLTALRALRDLEISRREALIVYIRG